MNFKEINIPHQYRNKYWYGDNQLGRFQKKELRELTTQFQIIYGTFSFNPNTGILSVIYE